MSDTDGKKTLGLRGGSRPGNVKQSFSHGRTKNVVVETKRKRVVVPKPVRQASGGRRPLRGDPPNVPPAFRMRTGTPDEGLAGAKAREAKKPQTREAEEKPVPRPRSAGEIEAKEREEQEREERAKAEAEEEERKSARPRSQALRAPAALQPAARSRAAVVARQPAPPRKDVTATDPRNKRKTGRDDARRSAS